MMIDPIEHQRLATVQADLVQLDMLLKEAIAKLSAGFIGAQSALSHHCLHEGQSGPGQLALVQEACAHLDSALTALQFEDIASQLIASARDHLRDSGPIPGRGCNRSVPQHHMDSGEIELF